jgi:hypothetical protein
MVDRVFDGVEIKLSRYLKTITVPFSGNRRWTMVAMHHGTAIQSKLQPSCHEDHNKEKYLKSHCLSWSASIAPPNF